MIQVYQLECKECGEDFEGKSRISKYCAPCRKLVRSRQMSEIRSKYYETIREKPRRDSSKGTIDKKWLFRNEKDYK